MELRARDLGPRGPQVWGDQPLGFLSGYDSHTHRGGHHGAWRTFDLFHSSFPPTPVRTRTHTHTQAQAQICSHPHYHRLTLRFIRVAPTPWGQLLTHHPCYPQAPLHPGTQLPLSSAAAIVALVLGRQVTPHHLPWDFFCLSWEEPFGAGVGTWGARQGFLGCFGWPALPNPAPTWRREAIGLLWVPPPPPHQPPCCLGRRGWIVAQGALGCPRGPPPV